MTIYRSQYQNRNAMLTTINVLTPIIALAFLTATVLLIRKRNTYPLIMRLWFYHVTLYWTVNAVVVVVVGHYVNPRLVTLWAAIIAIQAATSVAGAIFARGRWHNGY